MWAQACQLHRAGRAHAPAVLPPRRRRGGRTRHGSRRSTCSRTSAKLRIIVALPGVPAERVEIVIRAANSWSCAPSGGCRSRSGPRRSGGSRFRTAISSGASDLPEMPLEARHARMLQRLSDSQSAQGERKSMTTINGIAKNPINAAERRGPARRPPQAHDRAASGSDGHVAAAARRRADHPAGAQRRAVPRRGAADHASAASARAPRRRKRRACSARSACCCRASPTSTSPARTTCTGSAPPPTCCATSPRPTARITSICQGEQRFRVLQFLDGYPFPVARVQLIEEPAGHRSRDRGARAHAQAARGRNPAAAAAGARGDGRGAAERRGPGAARRLHRRPDGHERRGKAGAARDVRPARRGSTSCSSCSSHRIEVLQALARDRRAHQGVDRRAEAASTCCASRCARSRRSSAKATRRAAEIAELEKAIAEANMPEEVEKQARKELKRLERMPEAAGEYSMVRTYLDWLIELPWKSRSADADRHRRGAAHPRRGPLRPREDQEAHPRVPRGAQAQSDGQEPDPVLRRPARRGQDLARPEHRQGDRAQVRAREPGRRARRSRDPRPPAHLHRRAAGQHHPEHAQGGHAQLRDDARRGRQARRRRLPRRPGRRRCSKCSIPSRTRRSATTISRCRSTCRA